MRFPFGKNWRSFIELVDERRIATAEQAIVSSLGTDSLSGLKVLDIGSGSGLSSLAMHRLGSAVVSFDFDADSVACTRELRNAHVAQAEDWDVLQGSVLDADFMAGLGTFDLVYAWGVLHHTGQMWRALELSRQCVRPGGRLLVALYNDQGWRSTAWLGVKRIYCSGAPGRWLISATFIPLFFVYGVLRDLFRFQVPGRHMREYYRNRGMSIVHDWRDWLGGYPFEVASPAEIEAALSGHGFVLESIKLTRGWGCNELVFRKSSRA